jgi:uncharacterized protein (TIGR02246 family)
MYRSLPKLPAIGVRCWALAATSAALIIAVSASAAEQKPKGGADEKAILAAVESYVIAYNRGDAKAIASHWSESGEWTSPSGRRFQGKQAIEREMALLFAESKGLRIDVLNPTVRLVSPDVALEEGTVRVTRPGELPADSTYVAIHVKENGRWKLDSVRETEIPEAPPAASPLQNLAWLVGEWIDASPEATIETSVSWTKNKTFLSYAFKVSAPGMDDLEGTQVIGWDPAAGAIRSWMFDSDGGFGEGVWTETANGWTVRFSQVLPDARRASATNVYTLIDANTFTWQSVGRQVDGQFQPNSQEARVVRKGSVAPAVEAKRPREPASKESPRRQEAKP